MGQGPSTTIPQEEAAAEDGAGPFEQGPKWLTVKKAKSQLTLQVQDAATDALKEHGDDPLSLAIVFGRTRTGKSFLMNKLTGVPGLFPVQGGHTSITTGADLSSIVSSSTLDADGKGKGKLAFVDVEGLGSVGDGYDVALVTPLLLVSQVVIFNWPGKVAQNEVLTTLGRLAQAAERIKLEGSSRGNARIFGHLHFVLRDQDSIEGVDDTLFEDEAATDNEAENRNKIRQIIRRSFASHKAWGLPPPVEASRRLVAGNFTEAQVTPAFDAELGKLKKAIVEQLAEPVTLCGRALSAMDVAELMPLLANAVNEGQKEFLPMSLFSQLDQRKADAAVEEAIENFCEEFVSAHEEMPMAPATLSEMIASAKGQGVALIKDQLHGVTEDKVAHALDKFAAHVYKSSEALTLANEEAISPVVEAAKETAIKELEYLTTMTKSAEEIEEEKTLLEDFRKEEAAVFDAFEESVVEFGDAEAVWRARAKVNHAAKASWEAIRSHNQSLVDQQKAREKEAERKKAAVEAAGAVRERPSSSATSNEEGPDWFGIGLKVLDIVGRMSIDKPDEPPRPGPRPRRSTLGSQPIGTRNSNGSTSVGNGCTVDRNGRVHGPNGKFLKKGTTPYY